MHNSTIRGVSLLIVLLVGSIMLVVAVSVGALALRSVKTSNVRATSLKTQYAAQDAFACVKAQVDRNYRAFTNHLSANPVWCGSSRFNFITSPGGESYTVSGTKGVSRFTIPNTDGGGGVQVQIVRDINVFHFRGTTTVSAYSGSVDSPRTVQRLQEYFYEGFIGADIMFVVDRSGSIDGDRVHPTAGTEWGQLVYALTDSIAWLKTKVPQPQIGVLSFGYEPGETGVVDNGHILPDIPLVDKNSNTLPSNNNTNGNPADDDMKAMKTAVSYTNLSLGISIAGAELMGKYYPYRGYGIAPSGAFENLVANGGALSSLESKTSPVDRNDNEFPDYIIVITDGEPNSIVRQNTDNHPCVNVGVISGDLGFRAMASTSKSGQGMLFHTSNTGSDVGCLTSDADYYWCDDTGNKTPMQSVASGGIGSTDNYAPHQAMCNATHIVRALEANNVKVAVIGVGLAQGGVVENWLKDVFVSKDTSNAPLYKRADSYTDLGASIQFILGKLSMVQSL